MFSLSASPTAKFIDLRIQLGERAKTIKIIRACWVTDEYVFDYGTTTVLYITLFFTYHNYYFV
jgi:hypothetical protein